MFMRWYRCLVATLFSLALATSVQAEPLHVEAGPLRLSLDPDRSSTFEVVDLGLLDRLCPQGLPPGEAGAGVDGFPHPPIPSGPCSTKIPDEESLLPATVPSRLFQPTLLPEPGAEVELELLASAVVHLGHSAAVPVRVTRARFTGASNLVTPCGAWAFTLELDSDRAAVTELVFSALGDSALVAGSLALPLKARLRHLVSGEEVEVSRGGSVVLSGRWRGAAGGGSTLATKTIEIDLSEMVMAGDGCIGLWLESDGGSLGLISG